MTVDHHPEHGTGPVDDLDAASDISAQVGAALEDFLTQSSATFDRISVDVAEVGRSLLDFTRGGKRIRPTLLWWGFQLATGSAFDRATSATDLARAAASLELLHAAALIHDDVIDHSDTRRGEPALHRRFESLHTELGYQGDAAAFGTASAIVIGDICLALSEELFESAQRHLLPDDFLPRNAAVTRIRSQLRRDVMVGQFLDVRAEVIPLRDERIAERAWEVLSYKAAKYSVEQPLLLGAALGGADEQLLSEISRFGLPLGQAFQLRDDVLGIVGNPAETGKPAGDDIREGKRTVLITESLPNLSGSEFDLLETRLGQRDLSDSEVAECVQLLRTAGGLDAVERAIETTYGSSLEVLAEWSGTRLGPAATTRLAEFAKALSYRNK